MHSPIIIIPHNCIIVVKHPGNAIMYKRVSTIYRNTESHTDTDRKGESYEYIELNAAH